MQSKFDNVCRRLIDWLIVFLKEYYIVESGFSTDDAIEIIDENRGIIYVKEMLPIEDENETFEQEPEQGLFIEDFNREFQSICFI